jgi:phage terminase large subunit-like protein
MSVDIEPFQERAWAALNGRAANVLIYGGSGSGKTHLILFWMVLRALAKPAATHAIFRFRFNHLRASIIDNTLPKVCERYWPGQKLYELDRTDWYAEFVGGGKIYFGGLDEKVRTEKVLGQEHSTIYCNESSQISHASWLQATTRLRQQAGLKLKMVCDENPPQAGHWTERQWIKGVEPSSGKPLDNRAQFACVKMNPADSPYIPESYKRQLQAMPPRERERFWLGNFGSGTESPLWTYESIDAARVDFVPAGVTLTSVVVAIDPSGCHGPEDKRSDEIGIVSAGLGDDGVVYVLEDASGRFGPGGEDGWGARGIKQWVKWSADRIVGESNFGGAMVGATVYSARAQIGGKFVDGSSVPFHEVPASRGKTVRAEPVGTLTDRGRVKFVGHFPELYEQLIAFSTAGYTGDRSPDRADAFVWAAYALGVVAMPGQGALDWMREQATKLLSAPVDEAVTPENVAMQAPSHIAGTYYSRNGARYAVEDGRVRCGAEDVADLESAGFRRVS